MKPLKHLLIANRGEVAVRIIRACREMGIRTTVVYSDADAGSRAVLMADQAVHIGAAPPAESYLRGEAIVAAAVQAGCDSVHPGFGFLSENAAFAEAVQAAGLTFVGPDPAAIRAMGSKPEALALAAAADVPTVPGYRDDGQMSDYQAAAGRLGYPVMVKAAAGGGGKGMRIVHQAADLASAIEAAQREAARAFGDERIFLEKYIERARHIELQIFADRHGNTLHLFERDCSAQRRHQKIIEESPSPYFTHLSPPAPLPQGVRGGEMREAMGAAAVRLARAVNYVNAGTVEFIVDDRDGQFYFLEMNTRLQVEHPVTELVTGLDLVQWQLRVAAGEALPVTQAQLTQRGHAIECRLYAEDPANGFLPAIGDILRLVEPQAPRVRVDSGVQSGDSITIHYDPMIAKLIAYGETRTQAIRRLDAALAQFVVLGLTTNISFLREVLAHPTFIAGDVITGWVEREFGAWQPASAPLPDHALIAAALSDLLTAQHAPVSTPEASDADVHSPWGRHDSFRVGQR
jgi:acetyl-CoA carboxylase biotin carboxylase subunit